jgi:ribosomal protein L11 methyltransferase
MRVGFCVERAGRVSTRVRPSRVRPVPTIWSPCQRDVLRTFVCRGLANRMPVRADRGCAPEVNDVVPERWLVLEVRAPLDEAKAVDTSAALLELGGSAVEESGGWLRTYLPPSADPDELMRRARGRLAELGIDGDTVHWSWRRNEDWAETWKRGLRPRRVGQRLVVGPSWVPAMGERHDVVIVVDPGMAFGTVEHATTRGALRLLEQSVRPRDVVLDAGTGTGLLAIAAARLGAAHVLAVDNQREAVDAAEENVRRNGVAERIDIREATITGVSLPGLLPDGADLVVANILSSVLVPLLPALRATLRMGGGLILAGILVEEAQAVTTAASAVGLRLDLEEREDEWWAALFRRG